MKKLLKMTALLTALCMLCAMLPIAAQAQKIVPGQTKAPTQSGSKQLRTVGELKNYLHESLLTYPDVIEMEYAESLQPEIESGDVFNELLNYSYGVERASWNWEWKRTGGVFNGKVVISPIEYYDGIDIIKAVRNGTTDKLTQQQQDTLAVAKKMAQDALQNAHTLLEAEIMIHDAICSKVKYVESEEDNTVWDSAIGALLYGEAECDGYSDAFYLVGSLIGLNIGFQSGTAGGEAHLWNLVDIGGKWYHVDLTWDDIDDKYDAGIIRHAYFNAGSSLMETHAWDSACSPYIPENQTDWDMFYYTGGGEGAYYETIQDAGKYVTYQRNNGAVQVHVMVKGEWTYEQLHKAMKDANVYGKWTTWTKVTGGYTFFEVLFTE